MKERSPTTLLHVLEQLALSLEQARVLGDSIVVQLPLAACARLVGEVASFGRYATGREAASHLLSHFPVALTTIGPRIVVDVLPEDRKRRARRTAWGAIA